MDPGIFFSPSWYLLGTFIVPGTVINTFQSSRLQAFPPAPRGTSAVVPILHRTRLVSPEAEVGLDSGPAEPWASVLCRTAALDGHSEMFWLK